MSYWDFAFSLLCLCNASLTYNSTFKQNLEVRGSRGFFNRSNARYYSYCSSLLSSSMFLFPKQIRPLSPDYVHGPVVFSLFLPPQLCLVGIRVQYFCSSKNSSLGTEDIKKNSAQCQVPGILFFRVLVPVCSGITTAAVLLLLRYTAVVGPLS